ncbi:MAG: hypothetical protein Unbinned1446contig1005_36 [Prokaryotic dsDNA virus sp.]|nr:MAG: hypothetical protein Unbinned1446contig1005_36 [Prokaryotic dsDNA virus sp.]|tara:strand:+ start:6124 stop:6624 length:501 start_codon:yes stop_codon:yes gene_type:complete
MRNETTITSIVPQGTFEFKGENYFKFDVILENDMVGQVNTKSEGKWGVGDKVVVLEHTSGKYGPKLKLDRPRSEYGTNDNLHRPMPSDNNSENARNMDNRQDAIITQWAVREAQTFFANTASDPSKVSLRMIAGTALQFKQMAKDLQSYYDESKQQPEMTSDDLPF